MFLEANLLTFHPPAATDGEFEEERRKSAAEWCRQLTAAQQICWPILMPKLLLHHQMNKNNTGEMEKLDETVERKSSIQFESVAENGGGGPGKWPKLATKSIKKHHRWMEKEQRKLWHQQVRGWVEGEFK